MHRNIPTPDNLPEHVCNTTGYKCFIMNFKTSWGAEFFLGEISTVTLNMVSVQSVKNRKSHSPIGRLHFSHSEICQGGDKSKRESDTWHVKME
jgi:hypothetical protein